MTDGSDVLFFGNTANRQAELADTLGERALFGFPAAGGIRDGPVIRYVLITQQKTMLGEPDGATTSRVRELQGVLKGAGLPTVISANIAGWLQGHAAFVVPMAFALYRVDVDASRLAADPATMRLMVRATRQAFSALRSAGNAEIPTNLRILYSLPTAFVMAYWRRVPRQPSRRAVRSAPTAGPPLRRWARSRTNCEKPCAVPVGPHPTSTVCWPPQPEPGQHLDFSTGHLPTRSIRRTWVFVISMCSIRASRGAETVLRRARVRAGVAVPPPTSCATWPVPRRD